MLTKLADAVTVVKEAMGIFAEEPAVYFVMLALLSAGAGVARKFTPMKRR